MSNELQVYSVDEVKEMSKQVAESGLFGQINSPQKAMALMLLCQSEGIHPMQAVKRYHIIQGQPAMKADAMLGDYQLKGGKIKWITRTDDEVEAEFTHEHSGKVSIKWDTARAAQAGLTNKDNWRKYPCQMLSARVISEGVRASLPSVCSGLYTPEEVKDFDNKPAPSKAPPKQQKKKPVETAAKVENVEPYKEPPKEPEKKVAPTGQDTDAAVMDAVLQELTQCESGEELNRWMAAHKDNIYNKIKKESNRQQVLKAYKQRFQEVQKIVKQKAAEKNNPAPKPDPDPQGPHPDPEPEKPLEDQVVNGERAAMDKHKKYASQGAIAMIVKIVYTIEEADDKPYITNENDAHEFIKWMFKVKDLRNIFMKDVTRFVVKFNNYKDPKALLELYCKWRNNKG